MTLTRHGKRVSALSTSSIRALSCAGTMALLSACASNTPPMTATQEAATYQARAKPSYTPPGPPSDPWGPYIAEAAQRYDVPERWIREVMRVESGAHEYSASGALVTSPVGAMGLMQLMPETYDEVRAQNNLGDDAFDPHNNILAGAAYIRQMYDAFGTPGFLAAYNGGPARLQDYLVHNRPLPTETRRYVAMIGPYIQGIYPQSRSPSEELAVNQLPIDIPAGPRYVVHHPIMVASRGHRAHDRDVRYASRETRYAVRDSRGHNKAVVELAEAPMPRSVSASAVRVAYAAPAHHAGGWHLIDSADAAEIIPHGGGRKAAVQTAAYSHAPTIRPAAGHARIAPATHTSVAASHQEHALVYRAHVSSPVHEAATHACRKLAHHSGCSTSST